MRKSPALFWSEHLSVVILILGVESVKGPKGRGENLSLALNLPLTVSKCVMFPPATLLWSVSQQGTPEPSRDSCSGLARRTVAGSCWLLDLLPDTRSAGTRQEQREEDNHQKACLAAHHPHHHILLRPTQF